MRTWIFQANPSRFDVDGFLHVGPTIFTWLVTRYMNEIRVGDRVYLWRAASDDTSKAGVFAEAEVHSAVIRSAADEQSRLFWKDSEVGRSEADRVWLRLIRRANSKELLKRDWLKEDPLLRNLSILRFAAATNFEVQEHEARRLAQMWTRVGQDWTRSESLAGLWAYAKTLDGSVSRLPDSPVGTVSRITGRAVSGVYNKVMNFRSLDPRDKRAGMSGAGEADRQVWSEFFDTESQLLSIGELNEEFFRIWQSHMLSKEIDVDLHALRVATEREADKLATKTLGELLDAYHQQNRASEGRGKPGARLTSTVVLQRDSLVIAIARKRAGNLCEVPECCHPVFFGKDGTPYSEVHHIVPLAQGGLDKIENVVCLCPSHHREVHLGQQSKELSDMLVAVHFQPGTGDNVSPE